MSSMSSCWTHDAELDGVSHLLDLLLWGLLWPLSSEWPLDMFKVSAFIFSSNLVLPTVPISVLPLQPPQTHIRNKGGISDS